MDLTDESWAAVRHTPSVTGFVGHSQQPVPLSLDEVEKMLAPAVVAASEAAAPEQAGTAAELIKKAAGLQKGSGVPHKEKVGRLTKDQIREIATTKLPDLNANDVEQAMKIVEGTARSMGVTTD
jgi:ribosomal protein L11